MAVLVTGASGYIGNAVAKAFRRAGYQVAGLVRSDLKARKLQAEEIKPIIGDITQSQTLLKAASEAEILIHCASSAINTAEDDAKAIDALLAAAANANSAKTIIYTSGVWIYGNTAAKVVDETTSPNPIDVVSWRPMHEQKILNAMRGVVKTAVMRPGCVYGGTGQNSLTALWFACIKSGLIKMVGAGRNRWAMIHVEDLASAYVKVVQKELSGIFNVTDGSNLTIFDLVEAIAAAGGIPGKIHSLNLQEAQKEYGDLVQALCIDQMVSSRRAIDLLEWRPYFNNFLNDVSSYYQAWATTH